MLASFYRKRPVNVEINTWTGQCSSQLLIEQTWHSFCLARERPHDLTGFQAHLAAKVSLHNFCIWLNVYLGRTPLAFADMGGSGTFIPFSKPHPLSPERSTWNNSQNRVLMWFDPLTHLDRQCVLFPSIPTATATSPIDILPGRSVYCIRQEQMFLLFLSLCRHVVGPILFVLYVPPAEACVWISFAYRSPKLR